MDDVTKMGSLFSIKISLVSLKQSERGFNAEAKTI